MTSFRVTNGHLVNQNSAYEFSFDGKNLVGLEGDTVASALLANGVHIVGRGFKYHRPRGVWGSWVEEPNAVVEITLNGVTLPNCLATTTQLEHGMNVRSVNAYPSAAYDIKGALNLCRRWLGAGFYYKTFMWPDWHWFEPMIRKMAGLGSVNDAVLPNYVSDQMHRSVDVLVIGGGPAGLVAARAASEGSQSVLLVNDRASLQAANYYHTVMDGSSPTDWTSEQLSAFQSMGGEVMNNTTGFGIYDHKTVGLLQQQGFAQAPKYIRVRANRIILATGAIERPLVFQNNDLPGIMAPSAAMDYWVNYGVQVGQKIALATVHNAEHTRNQWRAWGVDTQLIDPSENDLMGVGRRKIRAVKTNAGQYPTDAFLACGGVTPSVHLWSHAKGGLQWIEGLNAYVPDTENGPEYIQVTGAAAGLLSLDDALEHARHTGLDKRVAEFKSMYVPRPAVQSKKRDSQWIDIQHDVTRKDIDVAVQENYASVEHVKRYTTLGMAIDQGKTSNMNGLAAIAEARATSIADVGITTYRPPFVPVPLVSYSGQHGRHHHKALKRLVLESQHRALNAALCEYGGWLRPGWYGSDRRDDHIQFEVLNTRQHAGILDASPLGKIEVMGPDARAFLNFVYYNRMDTLKPDHIRYGFMLTEGGAVYDDGVVSCVSDDHFVVSCSSSHVAGVEQLLESWRQDGNNPDNLFVHNATSQWATITVTGPKSRTILEALNIPVSLDAKSLPHMQFVQSTFYSAPIRIARVSFSGELSFEVSLPTSAANGFWKQAVTVGGALSACPIGLEAMSVMRAEKGFIIIGKDTDGETMPHDLGFNGPRMNKQHAFVGDRSLHTEIACDVNRRQWVGFTVGNEEPEISVGAHIVNTELKSIGVITSSYYSPTLNKPIALGLLEQGHERVGESVVVWHMGNQREATVTPACFYDTDNRCTHA